MGWALEWGWCVQVLKVVGRVMVVCWAEGMGGLVRRPPLDNGVVQRWSVVLL